MQRGQALDSDTRRQRLPRVRVALITLIIAGLVAVGAASDRSGAAETPSGTIVFASDRDGDFDIYAMGPDASGFRNLTRNAPTRSDQRDDFTPAWSPDGRLIAFARRENPSVGSPSTDIYVMNADGSGQRRITNNSFVDVEPDWTPDGKLVFMSCPTRRCRLVALDPRRRGADPVALSRPAGRLSPNGRLVLFTTSGPGLRVDYDVYRARLDGSNVRRLTHARGDDGQPAWSADGRRIVFVSERDRNGCFSRRCGDGFNGFNGEIYVMNADGSAQRRLTRHPGADITPTWSPDGTAIAFARQRQRNGDFEIMVMSVGGGSARAVTSNNADDTQPDWHARG